MKKIMIVDANGSCLGEGIATDEHDLTRAMETLVPMLDMFEGARLVVEDVDLEQFKKDVEKHYLRHYCVPCVATVQAKSYADAVAEVERMLQGQSLIAVDYRQLCDDDDDDYNFNDCFD